MTGLRCVPRPLLLSPSCASLPNLSSRPMTLLFPFGELFSFELHVPVVSFVDLVNPKRELLFPESSSRDVSRRREFGVALPWR